jgi:hypothetical protein
MDMSHCFHRLFQTVSHVLMQVDKLKLANANKPLIEFDCSSAQLLNSPLMIITKLILSYKMRVTNCEILKQETIAQISFLFYVL